MDSSSSSSSTSAIIGAGPGGNVKRNPSDFLKQVIGKPVVVELNSGVTYKGKWYTTFYFSFIVVFLNMQPPEIILMIQPIICIFDGLVITVVTIVIKSHRLYIIYRYISMLRWFHEYCNGADRRVCRWSIKS